MTLNSQKQTENPSEISVVKQIKGNMKNPILIDSKKSRKWILIEDDKEKAKNIIAVILSFFKTEPIYWLYTDVNSTRMASFLTEEDEDILFRQELKLEENEGFKKLEGKLSYHHCKSRKDFFKYAQSINFESAIVILDIKQPVFGNQSELDIELRDFLKEQLDSNYEQNELCITIASNKANYVSVKNAFKPYEDRINLNGSGNWSFTLTDMVSDCMEAIYSSNDFYNDLFKENPYKLEDFLEDMSKLDQHACHNWNHEDRSRVIYFKKKGRWHLEWDMPIQLSYLIKLLGYDKDDFVKDFDMHNERGKFYEGHPIGECLKTMGTKQQVDKNGEPDINSKGSTSFSFMGALFICWAAYRNTIKNEKERKDQLFIEAIKSTFKERDRYIARISSISPKQTYKVLCFTINSLYDMLIDLYTSSEKDRLGKDNLKEVRLDKNGVSIRLEINPESIYESIRREYENTIFGGNTGVERGGNSGTKIMKYFKLSNYCDDFSLNRNHLLGFDNSLKLFAAGKKEKNGLIIKLGHDT